MPCRTPTVGGGDAQGSQYSHSHRSGHPARQCAPGPLPVPLLAARQPPRSQDGQPRGAGRQGHPPIHPDEPAEHCPPRTAAGATERAAPSVGRGAASLGRLRLIARGLLQQPPRRRLGSAPEPLRGRSCPLAPNGTLRVTRPPGASLHSPTATGLLAQRCSQPYAAPLCGTRRHSHCAAYALRGREARVAHQDGPLPAQQLDGLAPRGAEKGGGRRRGGA